MIALLIAGAFALAFTLFLTPVFIKLFVRLKWGQFIRDDGPQSHHTKRGTPTMGGIVFILGATLGYFVGHWVVGDVPGISGLLVIYLMVGLGLIGFIDDFLKTRKQQSLGLGGWSKVLGQVIVAAGFAALALNFPDANGLTPASTMISVIRDIQWLDFAVFGSFTAILFAVWVTLIIVSASNGVNVADGLDGLASGAAIFAISSYIFIGFWQFNQSCSNPSIDPDLLYKCYDVRDPLDLAVIAAAIAGGLIGFLWWNTSPAQIFMGDTGALGLGGALAGLAILSRTELLLVLIGGLFLVVTGSVILQRAYFKISGGKRIFLMSPLHHHFELKGWAEVTVVVRFWLISALFVAVGVGLFYVEWVNQ
ncbi:phospho-N-acetylmuramoyl-pentapeptide-transferase [Microbacteriaceae bacterium SG_E_30_P1]|uniref:Phospho-N-acetylmuramoyl-pentapeptide-transferase n=1 Tax=Antiquaquibacter oligotrophicus TaxID=2880260 RepID=A0ABT6KLC3_9MICO|nr:phospho-N-acetylmuramoyl-pentapeptide-transferase [Antiquaquibacter oligotrophicus]MDH6180817.1 phospho-N-acetylmuramoyl-pentapeptide-transferase [Antiquaquibacter oligotrophicus]UDF13466.1 phospho-N-acetylmuramoyl-pentapeptide-transferase [Antiquaquibacter oligotrophicus]